VLHDELAFEVRWAVAGESVVIQLVAKLGESFEMNEFYSLFFLWRNSIANRFREAKGSNLIHQAFHSKQPFANRERWKRVEMHLKAMRFFSDCFHGQRLKKNFEHHQIGVKKSLKVN
jgi:hypothetical protein